MKNFYIIANCQKEDYSQISDKIIEYLENKGAKCHLHKYENKEESADYSYTDPKKIPDDIECILALGGDGTLIQAARDTAGKKIPLLGVNLGTLGYLTEIEKNNIFPALDKLLEDSYVIENRMMIKGLVYKNNELVFRNRALNDIVISREGNLRVIEINIYVNNQYLTSYNADGIIISTPTGATGYNLSAGGPIVSPLADVIVLTPICAHTLNSRSVILSATDRVEIEIGQGHKILEEMAVATYDGDMVAKMVTGDRIEITGSSKITKFVKISEMSFLEVLRHKMGDKQ